MRITRFQLILGCAVVCGGGVLFFGHGLECLIGLSVLFSLTGLGIGLGVAFPQWQMFGMSLCRVPTGRKAVALTFDDGPDPQNTPALLELLAAHRVRVSFFCIGERVDGHLELVRRMAEEGHHIENHSYVHSNFTNLFSVPSLRDDLTKTQAAIERATGRVPVYFRPPMGLTNQRVFRVTKELGLEVAGYCARGFDKRSDSSQRIAGRILRKVRPGAIVLLHDRGVPVERLLEVVTILLDQLSKDGYECLRLEDLAKGAVDNFRHQTFKK